MLELQGHNALGGGVLSLAKHLYTYQNPTSKRDLQAACEALSQDGVIAYPTDVNWAFGCDPSSKKAMEKIRLLKPNHPKEQPFTLLCSSIQMVASVAHIENSSYRVLKRSLPGPYTFLLKRTHDLPRQIKDKRKIVGVRVPLSPLLTDLIEMFGKPIASSSLPEDTGAPKKTITFGYELDEVYGHGLNLILDLGEEVHPNLTSVVDLTEGSGRVLRLGCGDLQLFERFGIELP